MIAEDRYWPDRRVVVFDADTGKYKRHWGAYGKKPTDDKEPPYDPAAAEDNAVQKSETTLVCAFG